jgi:hypothetical protein
MGERERDALSFPWTTLKTMQVYDLTPNNYYVAWCGVGIFHAGKCSGCSSWYLGLSRIRKCTHARDTSTRTHTYTHTHMHTRTHTHTLTHAYTPTERAYVHAQHSHLHTCSNAQSTPRHLNPCTFTIFKLGLVITRNHVCAYIIYTDTHIYSHTSTNTCACTRNHAMTRTCRHSLTQTHTAYTQHTRTHAIATGFHVWMLACSFKLM